MQQPGTVAEPEGIAGQLERDVHDALDTLNSSQTIHDWRTSGFTPTDVLNNSLALKGDDAKQTFCAVLSGLSDSQLSVFEVALSSNEAEHELSCNSSLRDRIKNYWIAQTEEEDRARTPSSEPSPLNSAVKNISSLRAGEFALVFEGPIDPILTREILQALDERGAKATFMVPGESARDSADLIQTIRKAGNSVGSQSGKNHDLALTPMKEAEQSIDEGAHAVEVASGAKSLLFSFPFDSSSQPLESFLSSKGFKVIRPDMDSEDWKTYDVTKLIATVRAQLQSHDRGIIVFHSNLHQTAIALPVILDDLAAHQRQLIAFQSN